MLDSLPFYVLLVDSEHHILLANKATRDALGLDPDEIIGQHCPQVVHGLETGTYPGCPLEEAVETGKSVEREHFDEKTERWLKVAIYPTGAWSLDGKEIYFHMIQDITEQKEAISRLRENEERSAKNFLRERNISKSLQSMLLPRVPDRTDIDIGFVYRSVDDYARIGGDFYDFVDLGDGKFAVALGDVSGHGLQAAKLIAMLKYTVRAYISEGMDIGTCLGKINKALCGQIPDEKFITLGLAVIDTARKSINYATAGHPLPLILKDGVIRQIPSSQGLPLGVMDFEDYFPCRLDNVGDSLFFMFSDGLIEAGAEAGKPFGRGRIHKVLKIQEGKNVQQIADDLVSEAVRYNAKELSDDCSLVILRIPG